MKNIFLLLKKYIYETPALYKVRACVPGSAVSRKLITRGTQEDLVSKIEVKFTLSDCFKKNSIEPFHVKNGIQIFAEFYFTLS